MMTPTRQAMTMLASLLATALAIGAPVPKAPTELKWKLAKGDTFFVSVETEMVGAIAVHDGGAAVKGRFAAAAVFTFQVTVTETDRRETKVEVEVLKCRVGRVEGNTALKLADEPVSVGKKMTFTLDEEHKMKPEGVDRLGGNLRGLFGGFDFPSSVGGLFEAAPGKRLGQWDTWTGETEGKLMDNVVVKRADRGKVAGTVNGLTRLEIVSSHMIAEEKSGLNLAGENGKRTILFDPTAGRVRKVTEEFSLSGNAKEVRMAIRTPGWTTLLRPLSR